MVTAENLRRAAWTAEGVAFLRRVMGGEVYTGLSGEALARWAVGLDDEPRDHPWDRGDLARCMNVYWSAPESLRPKIRQKLEEWVRLLSNYAHGEVGGRYPGPVDFDIRRYYSRRSDLDAYWGHDSEEEPGPRCLWFACGERQRGRHSEWWDDYGTCSRAHAVDHYGEEAVG